MLKIHASGWPYLYCKQRNFWLYQIFMFDNLIINNARFWTWILNLECTILIYDINGMHLHLMTVLVPPLKLRVNDTILLTKRNNWYSTCLWHLVVKFQYPFKIFAACHILCFMFCSAKVFDFILTSIEAIECLRLYSSCLSLRSKAKVYFINMAWKTV